MFEWLVWLLLIGGAGYLGFWNGVRRERGRQARYEEITRVQKQAQEGPKLKVIKLRR